MNRRFLLQGGVFLLLLLLFTTMFHLLLPIAPSRLSKEEFVETKSIVFRYVAIGDSLTEGVGDVTGQGGFVPLLAQDLMNQYGYEMDVVNYGISGNTSNQILKRMNKEEAIQKQLETANLMTLTVGGNDLRKVIIKNLSHLSIESFEEPSREYGKRLKKIIEKAREKNEKLPIYVLGIYNPFYLNFPQMTDMQIVVDNWNQTTQETVEEYDNVYFVPINDLIYRGLEEEQVLQQNSYKAVNNLLNEADSFHPNNTGYEIMKQAVMEKIRATKEKWNQ